TNTPTTPVLPLVQYQRPPIKLPRTPNQQILDNQVQQRLNQNYIIANPALPKVPTKPPHL
ncbi:19658_t:CDS:1, partial [Gigaspora margarita]